jgi:hypothetical protein
MVLNKKKLLQKLEVVSGYKKSDWSI